MRWYRKIGRTQDAFTLVELSTVLAIIGLLVGGIMVGRSLIHSAEIKNQVSQLQSYHSAFLTFQEKYNCTPGDCPNATFLFGTADAAGNAVNNGDGDGYIDTTDKQSYDSNNAHDHTWSSQTELWGAIQQLGLAGLTNFKLSYVTSTNSSLPSIKGLNKGNFFLGASYNFDAGRNPWILPLQVGKNALWIVSCNNLSDDFMGHWDDDCGIFSAADLQAIDAKIDDGVPLTGNVFGFGGWNSNNDCLVADGSAYKTSGTGSQCQASYLLD